MAGFIERPEVVAELIASATKSGLVVSEEIDRALATLRSRRDREVGASVGRYLRDVARANLLRQLLRERVQVPPPVAAQLRVSVSAPEESHLAVYLAWLTLNAVPKPAMSMRPATGTLFVGDTRGNDVHVHVVQEDAGAFSDLIAELRARRERVRPVRKGLRAEILRGIEYNGESAVARHAAWVTIMNVDGLPVEPRVQEQEEARAVPAVNLWHKDGVWIAQPAAPARAARYHHSKAFVTRDDDELARLVGHHQPIALHDRRVPWESWDHSAKAGS
jgi:hypothetical protein